ncbi:hypothetical protein GL279_15620 [Paracoccus limosus]|jgi:hypothetical protein|uniref:Uncharacterized protein n=1 Tax=Paracoccus limosus TaxID=913252 RepID=A0A844H8W0_9RHOB|nr:hypothetical protein [Paracoccus limosus]MTH36030.1 hypothetical protein [Paracoccus limosus]
MDDDPATGDATSTTVWTSFAFWHAQAKARAEAAGREIVPGWHVFNHGGAGKYMLRGAYRAQWLDLQKDCQAYWSGLGLWGRSVAAAGTAACKRTGNDKRGRKGGV